MKCNNVGVTCREERGNGNIILQALLYLKPGELNGLDGRGRNIVLYSTLPRLALGALSPEIKRSGSEAEY
jgi:hypothetical protein